MAAAPRKLLTIPFVAGLQTKGDSRAKDAPSLDIATDVEFDDIGGVRLRYPFASIGNALVGGGTLTNPRKLATRSGELLCFTDVALYSWVPSESAWRYRGDHPAVMTDEATVFAEAGDQIYAERCELNGQLVYAWCTTGGTPQIYVAVKDKATGATIQAPTAIGTINAAQRPRLVALASSVLLFYSGTALLGGGAVFASKLTLGPFAVGAQITVAAAPVTGGVPCFDVALVPGQDRAFVCVANVSSGPTGYWIQSVDETLSGFGGLYTPPAYVVAANAPIAIAVSPDAAILQVMHAHPSVVIGDLYNVTGAGVRLTSAALNEAIGTYGTGTAISQLTCAFRLTKDGGHYRCYGFWTCDEADNVVFEHRSNWADTSGATGTEAVFVYALALGAHAFAHDSHVYVVGSFGGLSFDATDPTGTHSELQNTYYLYRDDGLLVAKAVWGEGGGFHPQAWLPSSMVDVASSDRMLCMGALRRIVPVGANATQPVTGVETYAERAPCEIAFSFDDDRARRWVQLGATLYVTGGIVLQYDGAQLTEVGFCTYPWLLDPTNAGSGSIAAAGYTYKATDRWTNASGELDRSTTATVGNLVLSGASNVNVAIPNLYVTRKAGVVLEVWRTQGNPPVGAPFFLVTSLDPTVTSGNNAYLANAPTSKALASVTDALVDATLAVGPANPENGAVLQNIEPPAASIIATDSQRLFLAGIPGYPNTVYYSKYRQDGLVVAFNDYLSFEVPAAGGAITKIGFINGNLVVWCETATYVYAGIGYDDTGGGNNYQLGQIIPGDLGAAAPEAGASYKDGWLIKTDKGWYVLDQGVNYTYVGAGPKAFDDEDVLAAEEMPSRHQIRIQTTGRTLMFDTLVKQWATWSVVGIDGVLWNGKHVVLTASGPVVEQSTYAGVNYGFDVETSWIKPNDQQGRVIVDYFGVLGEFRSPFSLRVRMSGDYVGDGAGGWQYHTDTFWDPYPAIAGSSLQVRPGPVAGYSRCEALKIRLTAYATDHASAPTGPCARLTSIALQYADEPGLFVGLNQAQKV